VWEEIRAFEDKLGRSSDTGALDSVYESRRPELSRWVGAFSLVLSQIGLVAFQGKVPLGMDAVGSPRLYAKVHERVLTGYVLDAMEGRAGSALGSAYGSASRTPGDQGEDRRQTAGGPGQPDDDRRQPRLDPPPSIFAERFIERMRDAERMPSEPVGLGEYRVLKGNVVGSELVDQDKLVHLSAFPADDYAGRWDRSGQTRPPRPRNPGPIQRPSQRKRRY
jgi:hypothetical protein